MYVASLIVERIEEDGQIHSVCLQPENGHRFRIALADEHTATNGGPFFLPDEDDEKKFERESAKSRKWRLPEAQFTNAGGVCYLKRSCVGIRTEGQSLTYYALWLPKFAVPVPNTILVSDLRSRQTLPKSVAKIDHLKCFVIYLPCRAPYGDFDFELEARFRIETPDTFRRAKYREEHAAHDRYGFELIKRAAGHLDSRLADVETSPDVRSNGTSEDHAPPGALPLSIETLAGCHSNGDMNESQFRAMWVAKILAELMALKPRMYGPDSYTGLEKTYPDFAVFKIAQRHPDLRDKIENIKENVAVKRLACQLVAEKFGKELSTVQTDWKHYKPRLSTKR
jgi:hypothetical protein